MTGNDGSAPAEAILGRAMLLAQRAADELLAEACRDADDIRARAEADAETMLAGARAQAAELIANVRGRLDSAVESGEYDLADAVESARRRIGSILERHLEHVGDEAAPTPAPTDEHERATLGPEDNLIDDPDIVVQPLRIRSSRARNA